MADEIFKKRSMTKETQMRIEKQLYDTSTITDKYVKGESSQGAVTAGVKCLQYYMESKYAMHMRTDVLVRLSRISSELPEPDFEFKSQEEIDAMGKIAGNKYKAKVERFIKDKTARWFRQNEETVKSSIEGVAKEQNDFNKEVKEKVCAAPDTIQKKASYYEETDEVKKIQLAYDYVEHVISGAAEYVNAEEYKDMYSLAVDRADAMRLVLMSSSDADADVLHQIDNHEKRIQSLSAKREAFTAAKAVFSENDLKDKNIVESLKTYKDQLIQLHNMVETEGKTLEAQVISRLKGSQQGNAEESLSKYVSSAALKEMRTEIAKELKDKQWEDGTSNQQKKEFALEKKTECARNVMEKKKQKARDISIRNQTCTEAVHTNEKPSFSSNKMVVTIGDAEKYKQASNGFITYVPLEEQKDLYVLKPSMPEEVDVVLDDKPYGMEKFNLRKAHNILMRYLTDALERYAEAVDEAEEADIEDAFENALQSNTVEEFLQYMASDETEVSESEMEDLKHVICYLKQFNPIHPDAKTGLFEFVHRYKVMTERSHVLKSEFKKIVDNNGNTDLQMSDDFVCLYRYLHKKYYQNENTRKEFDALVERCMAELTIQKDQEYEKFLELKNLSPDSEVVPVINECRVNSNLVSGILSVKEDADNDNPNPAYPMMKHKFNKYKKPENEKMYMDYLKKYYEDFYNAINSIDKEKDPETWKEKYNDAMEYVLPFQYHFVPKVGETADELLSVEGYAPADYELFKAPVTTDAIIGRYQRNGETITEIADEDNNAYKPLSSISGYYETSNGMAAEDKTIVFKLMKNLILRKRVRQG